MLDNIDLEKGACAPCETKKARKDSFVITFDNTKLEKGACGRYHKKQNEKV